MGYTTMPQWFIPCNLEKLILQIILATAKKLMLQADSGIYKIEVQQKSWNSHLIF